MTVTLTPESLAWACKRLEEFNAVHQDGTLTDIVEAVSVLREGVGLDNAMLEDFASWTTDFVGDGYGQFALLGLLIGVLAVDHQQW